MPWTGAEFKSKHAKDLSTEQSSKAANIANAILEKTGDEGKAIRVAIARVKRGRPKNGGLTKT